MKRGANTLRLPVLLLVCLSSIAWAQSVPAETLKADVSFLASDAMRGRGILSPALDIAAEYIASRFRLAGLEPAGQDYSQPADFTVVLPVLEGLSLSFNTSERLVVADRTRMTLRNPAAKELNNAAAVIVTPDQLPTLDAATVRDRILVVKVVEPRAPAPTLNSDLADAAKRLAPSAVVVLRNGGPIVDLQPRVQQPVPQALAPWILLSDAEAYRAVVSAKVLGVSLRIPAPKLKPVKLRNVVGVLRGSDAVLRDSYVAVSAHYDHLGVRGNASGDTIFNGAIDNASGTASLLGIAGTLASMPVRPKRSIVFIACTGEEYGMAGSRFYCRQPLVPLASTVANINLEQTARPLTDPARELHMTGFTYTNLSEYFAGSGMAPVNSPNSDRFFRLSDNIAFAEAGVPSTTLSAIYSFPEYHRPGDEWHKLDYEGMATFTEVAARGILAVANSADVPRWNDNNASTAPFREARYPR